MTVPLRVIKLGGSLLEWPELPASLQQWLSAQPPAANVMIVGGGPIVEALRDLDHRLNLRQDAVHWAAVRVMDLMAELVVARLAGAKLLGDCRAIDRHWVCGLQVLCAEPFLRADAAGAGALPIGWQVTSDSIAARLARVLEADELVLLKSTAGQTGSGCESWRIAGLVDEYFPTGADGLSVRLVNLRDEKFAEVGRV